MEPNDQVLVCVDCQKEFTFTSGEQQFFDQKGFSSPPKRCKGCRELRRRDRGTGPAQGAPRGRGTEPSEYRSPAFKGSDPSRASGGRGSGGGWSDGAPRPPRPRRAAPDAITEYRAPSFSPRPVHAPFGTVEEIDEEADSIGNRLEPAGPAPRAPAPVPDGPPPSRAPSTGGGRGDGGAGGGERTGGRPARTRPTYPITCDGCGQASSVPFRPQPGRPVYCQDCYTTKKGEPAPAREESGE